MKFYRGLFLALPLSIALWALFIWGAFAQQQQASPEVQALQARVLQELNGSLQCTTQAITLQQQVTKLTADLKEMKDKYEPEKK